MTETLTINKYQVAIFPNNFFTTELTAIAAKIRDSIEDFDGLNSVLPVPKDAPRNFPRILVRSADNTLSADISFEKILITWNNPLEDPDFKVSLAKRQDIASKLMKAAIPGYTIKRIGWISEFFFKSDMPGSLSEKILKTTTLANLDIFSLNFTYKLALNSFDKCNRVIVVGSAKKTTGNREPVTMITIDINTHQDKNVEWTYKEVESFAEEAEKHLDITTTYKEFF